MYENVSHFNIKQFNIFAVNAVTAQTFVSIKIYTRIYRQFRFDVLTFLC